MKNYFREDPLDEAQLEKVPGLLHLYEKKVLLRLTEECGGECPFCFRSDWRKKNIAKTSLKTDKVIIKSKIAAIRNYLATHSEVEEVILSGGDGLLIEKEDWSELKEQLLSLKTIKKWRWHSRLPVFQPFYDFSLWEKEWQDLKNRNFDLTLVLHLNSATEISDQLTNLVKKWRDLGLEIKAQGVLLARINDEPEKLRELWNLEMKNGIEPYYLHHLDRVVGAEKFWVGVERGKEIFFKAEKEMKSKWGKEFKLKYVVDLGQGQMKVEVKDLKKVGAEKYEIINPVGKKCYYFGK